MNLVSLQLTLILLVSNKIIIIIIIIIIDSSDTFLDATEYDEYPNSIGDCITTTIINESTCVPNNDQHCLD